jgi:hypothetical protein
MDSVLISEEGQHDDHCRLTFMGQNWYIDCIEGSLFFLRSETGEQIMDASAIRWDEYCEMAAYWLTII